MTGMTRDGLYLVENGKVTSAVRNFRFNNQFADRTFFKTWEAMSPRIPRATAEEAFENGSSQP